MSEIDYAARVQRGAALLDEKWPTWAQDIDLDKLDIASGFNCVTAQYAQRADEDNNWADGRFMLGLNYVTYEEYGFKANDADTDTAYPTLTALWRDLIQERRAQAQPEASER